MKIKKELIKQKVEQLVEKLHQEQPFFWEDLKTLVLDKTTKRYINERPCTKQEIIDQWVGNVEHCIEKGINVTEDNFEQVVLEMTVNDSNQGATIFLD